MSMRNLTPKRFDSDYRAVFERVFLPPKTVSNPRAIPFADRSWQVVAVLAVYGFEPPEYDALRSAARSAGDTEAVIMDAEAEPRPLYPAVFSWPDAWMRDLTGDGRFGMDLALFGRSGRWGAYLLFESYIAYVGGEPGFMDVFLADIGGIEVIKRRLKEAVAETESPWDLRCMSETLAGLGWAEEVMGDKQAGDDRLCE
jgi:hypothetical protein